MAYTNFTNCTKEQYESIIYSEEDTNRIRIWFNNVELLDADEYCESFSGTNRILPDDGNKIFTLDNFVAKNYTLILRDLPEETIISDQVKVSIGTLVNANNNTYEDVPIGIFNIQDTPINDKGRVTIKLRDNRVKFDFNYNAQPLIESLGGTATKKQILEDICNQAGVTNNVSTFDGEDDEIGIYDNTITATTYVSYIFEQAGLMPFINREGQLDKINLNDLKVWRIPLSIVEKYEKGTPFKIERVVYESGIIKYESSNDETLDTLYLNSANPYINNKQQIDNIYNLLVGFSVDSVKSGKILGNPAIDPFDMILIYDDEINDNPISTSTGTNLTLQNTPNASTNIDLLGNTTQDTTTGKNLLKNASTNSGDNNYWYQYSTFDEATGTLTRSTTATTESYITHRVGSLKSNTTYTLSLYAKSNGYVKNMDFYCYNQSVQGIKAKQNMSLTTNFQKYTFTFITASDVTYGANSVVRIDNNGSTQDGTEAILTIKDVMLVEGEDTEYEPYTNGASPNPNYPQEVHTITGENTIKVCGKNLLDMQNGTYVGAGITAIVNNGTITLNGTASGTSFINVPLKNIISINGSFTISANNNFIVGTISNWAGIRLGNVAYDTIGGQTAFSRTNTSETFNVENKDAYYLTIRTASGLSYNNNVIYPQIEKGSSSSSYEPFKGNSYEVNLGKNLFDYSKITTSANFTNNNDGSFTRTANGTNMTINTNASSVPYNTFSLSAGTYSVSFDITTTANTTLSNFYLCTTQNGTNTNIQKPINISITANTKTHIKAENCVINNNAEKVGLVAYFSASTGIVISNIQVEKGSTASSYSPYFEPIELCKIGTYQDRLFKASGKNLFDKDNANILGVSVANGVITTNANAKSFYIPIKSNTTYTISREIIGARFVAYTTNVIPANGVSVLQTIGNNEGSTITITTSSNANYLMIYYRYNATEDEETILSSMQIELGSTATTYEPYGNYWYKYNAIGKVVLDGTETWVSQSYGTNSWALNNVISVNYDANKIQVMSRKFKGVEQVNRNTNDSVIYTTSNSQVYIRNTPYTTLAQAQSGMNNEPLYYVLATPTYTKIENEELIGQLNRLKTIQTVEGTTNIQQDSSSSPFELNVEYFNESYILKTLANNTYKYTGINRNEFNTEISLEQRKENVSIKSEATYQKIAKTEIDAANASISMITGELGIVDGQSQVINGIIQYQDKNSAIIKAISSSDTTTDENGNIVPTGVKTEKGFTFDKNGLNITSSDNTYKTQIDEQGTYYYDGDEILGQTTKDGSKFKNMDLYGEFHYGMDKITDNPLFVSLKFSETNNGTTEQCFGHFWNGD